MISNVARHPLLHFALLGTLIFAAQQQMTKPLPVEIVISAQQIAALQAGWRSRQGAVPTVTELRGLVERAIDEEIMLAQARSLGLDQHNPRIDSILIEGLRYAGFEQETDAQLLARAEALNLASNDPLVKRVLVETVRALWGQVEVIPEDRILTLVAERAEALASDGYHFELLYFPSGDGDGLLRIREQLSQQSLDPQQVGSSFALGHRFEAQTLAQLEQRLGSQIATAVQQAEPGVWSTPVQSRWGWHLLRVMAVAPLPTKAEALRQEARRALRTRLAEEAVEARLAKHRQAMTVRVDWPAIEPTS